MALQHSLVSAGHAASLLGLQDVMDRVWFQGNILSSVFSGFNVQQAATTPTATTTSQKNKNCTTLTQKRVSQSSLEPVSMRSLSKSSPQETKAADKNNELQLNSKSRKKLKRLNIDTRPLGWHPQALPTGAILSCPTLPVSSPTLFHGCCRDAKRSTRLSSHKSMSDLEKIELEGFMDLGFVFHKESLSMELMSLVPGLQKLEEECQERRLEQQEKTRRPYLSEAWMIGKPVIPILRPQVRPNSPDGASMKKQLQSWARDVASIIQHNYHSNNTGMI